MSCNTDKIKIFFFGDITGRQGRIAIKNYLACLKKTEQEPFFVIANIENASHGFGLTKKNYEDLASSGIDCFTSAPIPLTVSICFIPSRPLRQFSAYLVMSDTVFLISDDLVTRTHSQVIILFTALVLYAP